jgi:hypothetical protein
MLVLEYLGSVKHLRVVAAAVRADMPLIYSIDTRFHT